MKSIATAEKMHGTKIATPKKVEQESFKPVKYDVEDVSIDHSLIQGLLDSETNDSEDYKIENLGSAAPILHSEKELKARKQHI